MRVGVPPSGHGTIHIGGFMGSAPPNIPPRDRRQGRPAAGAVMTDIRAGFGFNVGQDFARASHDIPIALAPLNMPSPVM